MTRSTARGPGTGAGTTKKTSAKKAPAKKAPAAKTPAKGSAPRKAPSAEASRQEEQQGRQGSGGIRASQVAGRAAAQLLELTGKEAEGVVGLERTDEGWLVQVEVLELRRIPSTTDVLATYEVAVDRDGELTSYRRRGRFVRGSAGEEGR